MADIPLPGDSLTKAADKAAENSAQSAMDTALSGFRLSEQTPDTLAQDIGTRHKQLATGVDLAGSLGRFRSAQAEQEENLSIAAPVESQFKDEELSKTPLSGLDGEIQRLMSLRWQVLPSVLARDDIISYSDKLRLAEKMTGIIQGQVDDLTKTREKLVTAAENRAKIRADTMKAEAERIEKKANVAKTGFDLSLDLFKEGKGSVDDMLQAAMDLQDALDSKKKGAGAGNLFVGTEGSAFSPTEIAAFAWFEKTGDWPAAMSVNQQAKLALTQRYMSWQMAGRPGSQVTVTKELPLPAGQYGPPNISTETKDVTDLFSVPAEASKASAASALAGALGLK